jgi:hypothetical protein
VNGQSTISPAVGDDTIELQLTPEQLRYLSEAGEVAESVAAVRTSGRAGENIVKMAAAIIVYGAFAWWSASHLAAQPQPAATAAAKPAALVPRPALIASSPEPTVQISNPFDATEVFQFPAGTGYAEDQEKVAQILLQRARERQSQWERAKPVVGVRTASLYRSP